jgi:NAD-reducing hydrogenase small subunit
MTAAKKLKVATTSLAGCFGCHMSFLDIDERLFTLLEHIEFDRSPLTDIKHCSPDCDIGIIEGGCAMPRTSMCCANSARTARS